MGVPITRAVNHALSTLVSALLTLPIILLYLVEYMLAFNHIFLKSKYISFLICHIYRYIGYAIKTSCCKVLEREHGKCSSLGMGQVHLCLDSLINEF